MRPIACPDAPRQKVASSHVDPTNAETPRVETRRARTDEDPYRCGLIGTRHHSVVRAVGGARGSYTHFQLVSCLLAF
jgi:hypothetical protein